MRTIRLPFPVDPSAVQADYDNGVLTVTLPKPAEAKQRSGRIEVRGGARQGSSQADGGGTTQALSGAAEAMRSSNASETAGAGQEAPGDSQQKATAS